MSIWYYGVGKIDFWTRFNTKASLVCVVSQDLRLLLFVVGNLSSLSWDILPFDLHGNNSNRLLL